MRTESEIQRRKQLRREADLRVREAEEIECPVPRPDLLALFDHLDSALVAGCNHSLELTQRFLDSRGVTNSSVVPWLIAQGGGCDCEVLANLEDRWGAA